MSEIKTIAIIGCGKMGSALAGAIYSHKIEQPPQKIIMTTKTVRSLNNLKEKFLVQENLNAIELLYLNDNRELVKEADAVILAMEPFLAIHILEEIKDLVTQKFLISIIAGFRIDKLELYTSKAAIIMTSTLVNFTRVPIGYTLNTETRKFESYLAQLFEPVGELIEIKPNDLDATGAVLGCSTLFTLIYIDAIIKGGVSRGLTVEQSKKMILGVLKGTSAMLEQSGKSPDDIIAELCTPGGTTIDGIMTLEEGKFRYVLGKLVQVSTDKAKLLNDK